MRTFLIGLSIVLGSAALPVWLFLMYKVLAAVGASDLMWFLFWLYVPLSVGLHVISRMIQAGAE